MNDHMDKRPDDNRPNRNNPKNQGPNKNRQTILGFLICLLISLVCLSFVTDMMSDSSSEITYDKFIEMVDKDQVKEVTLQSVGSADCRSKTSEILPERKLQGQSDGGYQCID